MSSSLKLHPLFFVLALQKGSSRRLCNTLCDTAFSHLCTKTLLCSFPTLFRVDCILGLFGASKLVGWENCLRTLHTLFWFFYCTFHYSSWTLSQYCMKRHIELFFHSYPVYREQAGFSFEHDVYTHLHLPTCMASEKLKSRKCVLRLT